MSTSVSRTRHRATGNDLDNELDRIERMIGSENVPRIVRALKSFVSVNPDHKRAWQVGVRAFTGSRYDYTPPRSERDQLSSGRRALAAGNRMSALRIATLLV